ncbi:hypothetical protein E4U47_004200 [Claviceps purpurea]|nr:hypothetical protein E4U47_004200 [Claviceps purpurea]
MVGLIYGQPSKTILDIGSGFINLQRWPMSPDTGRPIILHTDELRFHYGAVVAASRESELWLAQLSDEGITGPQAMIDYVAELVERRWVPETLSFMAKQLRKKLHRSTYVRSRISLPTRPKGQNTKLMRTSLVRDI